jgi:hypothetical protein
MSLVILCSVLMVSVAKQRQGRWVSGIYRAAVSGTPQKCSADE